MALTFSLEATDRGAAARAGRMTTAHGEVLTPAFMPVGTAGSVKALAPDDLVTAGTQILLGNTYHLLLRPGPERVAARCGCGPESRRCGAWGDCTASWADRTRFSPTAADSRS